jgi:pyruvate-formate lyase
MVYKAQESTSGGVATGDMRTGRVARLRSRMLRMPEVCIQRAYWWNRSYQETEGEPEVVRRARALARVLQELPVKINEDELIVGMTTSKQRGSILFPEIQWEYVLKEAESFSSRDWDTFGPFDRGEFDRLAEVLPYWKGKCTWDRFNASLPPEVKRLHGGVFMIGTASMSGVHYGHETIDYARVLTKGLRGIKAEVEEKLAALDLARLEDFRKYQFFSAVCITLDAAMAFAGRYAELARHMAADEADPERRAELERIAAVCARVPAEPAGT